MSKLYRSLPLSEGYFFLWGLIGACALWAQYPILAAIILVPLRANKTAWLGALLATCGVVFLFLTPIFLQGQKIICKEKSCSFLSMMGSNLTFSTKTCPSHSICKIEKIEWVHSQNQSSHNFLPRLYVSQAIPLSQVHTEPKPFTPSIALYSQGLFQSFHLPVDTVWIAQTQTQWHQVFGSWGVQHLLCFSGWHAHKIWKLCRYSLKAFSVLAGILLLALGIPFPFLCAYVKLLCQQIAPPQYRYEIGWIVLSVVLILHPYCWVKTGTWLTVYYILLIEMTGFCENSLRIGSLGWSVLFTGSIEVIPWVLGLYLEKYFEFFFLAVIWLYGGSFLFPVLTERICSDLFSILNFFCHSDQIYVLSDWLGYIFLALPFFLTPSWTVKRAQRDDRDFGLLPTRF